MLDEFLRDEDCNYYDDLFDYLKSVENIGKFRLGGQRASGLFGMALTQYCGNSVADPG
ncbi:MAG: hypothetical protein QXN59_02185 [Candidatus Micrarchaeaceae archaeon]